MLDNCITIFQNLPYKIKKERRKPASHKEVYAYFVGTGVLDCPLARKFDTQKAKR